MFIYSLDTTITADLVPSISNAFDSVPELPWLSVGFTAGAFVGLLPMGRLYAKFNVKYVYIISVVVFLASSALCGAAPNMTAMIFGRVFLGVAGSAMYCGIMTLITIFATDAERPLYFALCGLVWSVGTVLGPVVGGAFAKANWRWAFYFNLIVGGLFLPLCIFLLPSFDPVAGSAEKRRMQRLKTLDFLGTILLIAFPLCLLMGINFGGILYPWNSGSIIALFVVGGVLGLAFVTQQYFSCLTSPAERLFPGLLFWHREPLLLFIISIGTNIASFIAIFYIPLYFQFTKGDTPIEAAVRLLPQIIVFSVFNMIQGAFVVKLGYYWPWFLAGGAAILAGNMMLCKFSWPLAIPVPYFSHNSPTTVFVRPGTENAYIYGSEVVLAIGLGLCNQVSSLHPSHPSLCCIDSNTRSLQTPFSVIHSVVHAEDMGLAVPSVILTHFAFYVEPNG